MPYTIVIAVPEPVSKVDKIELDKVQAYFIEESEEFGGFYAGYKPAIVRKLGVENIDVYYLGCYEDNDHWSSWDLVEDTETDSYLNISEVRLNDFETIYEALLSMSEKGKLYLIMHDGVSVKDESENEYIPEQPSEKYLNYDLHCIDLSEFLKQLRTKSSLFKVESIWEIYKF